jgi:uroporphyrinogen decarboxylase
MNSRERVLAAIKSQPTDRIPYNFRAEDVTLEKIYRHTGQRDFDALMDQVGSDIRHIDAIKPPEKKLDGCYQNYWGERYVYKPSEYGPVREDLAGALAGAETLDALKHFDWVKNDDFDYSEIAAQCDRYEGRAIMYGTGDIWERPSLVRGMENFFEDMIIRPEFCHYLCDVFTDFYVEDYRRAFKASGGRIDLFLIYTDLGSQIATLISREMLHTFVIPYIKRMADAIHEMGAHFFFHSCGMVHPFIPDLIAAGVDILDPIQPCSPDMQPEALARDFSGRICFNGGIDIQSVLVKGTPEQVRAEVQRYKKAFNNKGYICAPSHLLQADTPVANIFAMYDEVRT